MTHPPEALPSAAEGLLRLPPDTDLLEWLLSLEPEHRAAAVDLLGPVEREAFDRDWASWAHEGQGAPPTLPDGSAWSAWVLMAGRGFGKTLAGSNWVTAAVATGAPLHIALVGATLDEARRVMVEGRSGLIAVADAWITEWAPSLRRLKFRTGAEAVLFSGASPDQLRGPEHHLAWCDELAKWEKPRETWDMLQFGLRLGEQPRALITTTPRSGPVLAAIIAEPGTVLTHGRTRANPHSSESWRRSIHARYAGTRLGRQELDGELLPEAGALWSPELLEKCRLPSSPQWGERRLAEGERGEGDPKPPHQASTAEPPLSIYRGANVAPRRPGRAGGTTDPTIPTGERGLSFPGSSTTWTRLVIAVDPPSGGGTCGIIACAKDSAGLAHVLADHSVTGASPERWAKAVADAVQVWTAILSAPAFAGEGDRLQGGGGAIPPRNGEGDQPKAGGGGPAPPIPLVVAEQNQGGRMVATILRTADPNLRVKPVTATVGKAERAAPIAHLFEAGKVVLHGRFPELEGELLGMVSGGDYQGPGSSPDRADAMVWGLTELMLGVQREPSIRRL